MIEWIPIVCGAVFLGSGFLKKKKKPVEEALAETFANCGLQAGKKMPLLIKKIITKAGYKLIYHIPEGLSDQDFINRQKAIETATNSTAIMWLQNGHLHMDLLMQKLPQKRGFEFEAVPGDMALPVPIGWSRAGLEWLDLAEAPHLSVNGQTFGGKSNFLHQALVCLVRQENVQLFIIDLKRLEFSYMRNHSWYGHTLSDAVKILEYLTKELHRRLEALDKAGCVKIQDYKGNDLPYMVLVIDELSQLNPDGEVSKDIKKIKEHTHTMLSDLAALARAVGIHLVLSTQRPDHKILPGSLKANIPAKLCYPVVSRVNSEIVLDNDAAYYLPRIKGRGIFRWHDQREVQTMFLPLGRAKKLLKKVPPKSPEPPKSKVKKAV